MQIHHGIQMATGSGQARSSLRNVTLWFSLLGACLAFGAEYEIRPGLATVYHPTGDSHAGPGVRATVTDLAFYVEAGESPTSFLHPGPFRADCSGFLSVDLRSEMFFQVESSGPFTVEINGQKVAFQPGETPSTWLSDLFPLSKGTNALLVAWRSALSGDSWLRLFWGEEMSTMSPIPPNVLSHVASANDESEETLWRQGRALALEYRCFHCHKLDVPSDIPELTMDAPSFDGIGARRNFEWMSTWIHDPKSRRPSARMPALLHGPSAQEKARAMAAYLASQRHEPPVAPLMDDPEADRTAAESIRRAQTLGQVVPDTWYERLHCGGCHGPLGATEVLPPLLSLRHVTDKFPSPRLREFLRKPEAHYRWIRMPNFHLTAQEAELLAKSLEEAYPAQSPPGEEVPNDPEILARGQSLVQTMGCLNCHAHRAENRFSTKSWRELQDWKDGCMDNDAALESSAPAFHFTPSEQKALTAFAQQDANAWRHHVPAEFAERQVQRLQCLQCHENHQDVPAWDTLRGKLKPEWTTRLLQGNLPGKTRPWLPARMPSFGVVGQPLARGLAMRDGQPPETPPEPAVDPQLAQLGQRLLMKDGGFSCVSCHAIGSQKATEVFEAEGINFSHVADRLQRSYYHRWMSDPSAIDPQTKMPRYFEEGYSPLTDVLDGDANRQIDAMWQYFRTLRLGPATRAEEP